MCKKFGKKQFTLDRDSIVSGHHKEWFRWQGMEN